MAKPKSLTLAPQAPDDDSVCESQTPGAGGSLTFNGDAVSDGVATFATPCRVGITPAGDESGRTFVLTGTDRYGRSISETLAGTNATEIVSALDYKTVTDVTIDDSAADAIKVGNTDALSTAWIPRNRYQSYMSQQFDISGTINYTLQHTLSDVQAPGFREDDAVVIADGDIAGETTDQTLFSDRVIVASRVIVNSYSAGATLVWRWLEGTP